MPVISAEHAAPEIHGKGRYAATSPKNHMKDTMEDTKKSILNEENFNKILGWLNNDGEQIPPDFAESFMTTLYYQYMEKTGTPLTIRRRRTVISPGNCFSLKRLFESVQKSSNELKKDSALITQENPVIKTEDKKEQGQLFPEQEKEEQSKEENKNRIPLGVVVIGKAARSCAKLHGIKLSRSHIQIILYALYGYRLAKELEDVFGESPRMWKYGPVFPSSYHALENENDKEEYDCWRRLNQHDVNLGVELINLVSGLGERKVKELAAKHTALGTPWHECRVMNPDKWGTIIPAENIKEWFKKNNKGHNQWTGKN